MKRYAGLLVGCVLLSACDGDAYNQPTDRDNTGVNQRDAENPSATPLDQSNDSTEIDQVAEIRQAVMAIEDLSTNGQNVKIITGEGRVTLRGPVNSQTEKDAIEQAAKRIAGEANVVSELEIESD